MCTMRGELKQQGRQRERHKTAGLNEQDRASAASVLRALRLSFDFHLSTSFFDVLFEKSQSQTMQTCVCLMPFLWK